MEQGKSTFSNKLNDFQMVVDKYSPHIISLSEANYCNVTKMIFPEYNIEINDLGIGYSQSRLLVLIHKSLQYKRRRDLDEKFLAVITCDIILSNNKNITISAIYRQWKLPSTIVCNEHNMTSQNSRYSKFISNCEKILSTQNSKLIILGDDNIDSLNNHNLSSNFNNNELKDIRDQ